MKRFYTQTDYETSSQSLTTAWKTKNAFKLLLLLLLWAVGEHELGKIKRGCCLVDLCACRWFSLWYFGTWATHDFNVPR